MKAYRFRLASVLRVRELQQRVATQDLAAAARQLHRARAEHEQARRSLDELVAPEGHLTAGDLQWAHAQSERVSNTADEKTTDMEAAGDAARQATVAWGSARRRTAMLERLDERHVALWRTDLDRSEAVELDELATARTTRNGSQQ